MKCSIWRRDSALPSRRLRISVGDNEHLKMMLCFIRIIEATKDDVDMLLRKVTNQSSPINGSSNTLMMTSFRSIRDASGGINPFNEYRAMQHLQLLCESYLSKYPNTYESDCQRLASHAELPLFSNERHAVIQVRGEKEVLLFFRDFAIVAQHLLRIRDIKILEDEILSIRATKHAIIVDHAKNVIHKLLIEEYQRQAKNGSQSTGSTKSFVL